MIVSPIAGFLLGLCAMKALFRLSHKPKRAKLFSHLQIASASLVALAHGLNDAQKSMAVITLGLFASGWIVTTHIPFWVIIACALMMGLGTATGGFRIIRTVGFEITRLQPVQGFAAETSASCVILAASFLGMPVSSTHMIVGSIAGVGAVKGMRHVAWATGKKILLAWVFTLPGSAFLSAFIFKIINQLSY
jgi:PiT family inorganic phosphate transporter